MKNPSLKLIHLLIGKAIAETFLVSVIAVGFYVTAFPPTFHGWSEAVSETQSIAGWVVNDASPWERVDVQLFVDNKFVGEQTADLSRPDVQVAGWANDDWHGFSFQCSELTPGPHEARVYAVHQSGNGKRYTLQLLGDPLVFNVETNGGWRAVVSQRKN
ncbi:MAG TPA: hypothetical protein VJ372_22095 [Pyrinomonadaceae bacterium]|jgi:hypothetical protein|nr:hypothetical protein [Pyrinomonadaceae bacterium]